MSAQTWQKSSYCGEGESCIHVSRPTPTTVRLTESSDPSGAILDTTPAAFAGLLRTIRDGHRARAASPLAVTHTPDGTVLVTHAPGTTVVTTARHQWRAFALGVQAGEFDHFAAVT